MSGYSSEFPPGARQAYIVARMEAANERMLTGATPSIRMRAGRWVIAWGMKVGAEAPARLKLRPRDQPARFGTPADSQPG